MYCSPRCGTALRERELYRRIETLLREKDRPPMGRVAQSVMTIASRASSLSSLLPAFFSPWLAGRRKWASHTADRIERRSQRCCCCGICGCAAAGNVSSGGAPRAMSWPNP